MTNLWLISILSWLLLSGLGCAGLLVSKEDRRREKLTQRITSVVAPHMRTHRLELSAVTEVKDVADGSLFGFVAKVFGFNPSALDRYPLKWWIILIITLAAAKGGQVLSSNVLGWWSILGWPFEWLILSRMIFGFFEKRYHDKLLKQFPDALNMIVRTVRVGIPVMRAMRNVALDAPLPTRDVFSHLVNQISIGVALDAAVLEVAERTGLPEYRFFATAITLQMQTGGALSETLDNLADVIRRRVALKARGLALASEARTSAAVLAGLPFVSGTALWALNPAYIGMLFEPGLGQKILSGAVLMLGIGLATMRSLIRRSLS